MDNNKKVFVTYSWDDKTNDDVYSFVDMLRKKGFDAECDKNKLQRDTSESFSKIMSDGLSSCKVIVVLSKSYKKKAEDFEGGVGIEYKIISNDININSNKYILVSFDSLTKEVRDTIVPKLYISHQIIDMSKDEDDDFEELFAKLLDKDRIDFSEVGNQLPNIKPKKLKNFSLKDKKKHA